MIAGGAVVIAAARDLHDEFAFGGFVAPGRRGARPRQRVPARRAALY